MSFNNLQSYLGEIIMSSISRCSDATNLGEIVSSGEWEHWRELHKGPINNWDIRTGDGDVVGNGGMGGMGM